MTRVRTKVVLFFLFLFLININASDKAEVGKAAPDFNLTGSDGQYYALSNYKDKFIVLEWNNFDCPFVKKHYDSKNMQTLQKKYTDKGVIWLTINSSAKGKQGFYPPYKLNNKIKEYEANITGYLLDNGGTVGKKYGAKTTPHMYVINPEGILIYAGGIDDIPSTDIDDIKKAKNYVSAALDAAMEGKPVEVKTSQPYGCSVKY
ncbi:MAG: thioredoxin family protein [Bacteroidetes bacterium]|nr:thioredoxin family protein [Bacteroidota bacterium]